MQEVPVKLSQSAQLMQIELAEEPRNIVTECILGIHLPLSLSVRRMFELVSIFVVLVTDIETLNSWPPTL